MALLFFDNFGGYTVAQAGAVWGGGVESTPTISSSGGRNGGPYATIPTGQGSCGFLTRAFTPSAAWGIGVAVQPVTSFGTAKTLVLLLDAGTVQCALIVNADGTLSVVRGTATSVTDGTSVLSLSADVWQYVEMKVTIADSIGASSCQVYVDGILWITVATGQDLKVSANATANQVKFGSYANIAYNIRLTDIYIKDDSTLLGDCTVSLLTATGNGTTQQFTSSSGGHYTDVDDATHDTDATYVESSTNGHVELFSMSNLTGTPATIHAVAPWNLVRKTDGGAKSARSVIRSGGANYGQADFAATDAYKYDLPITTVDPATAAAWTATNVNAIEVGIEVRS